MSATPNSQKGLSLRRNISWTLVGNLVYALSQWGMLVILARMSSPHIVGQYSLALAVSAPVYMALNLQLRGVQATDANKTYLFGDYLVLRVVTTIIGLIFLSVIVYRYAPDTRIVIGLISLAKAFETISDVLYGRMQAHERMDSIARSTLIKGPVSLLALFVGFLWEGLPGAAGLLAAGWLLLLVAYDLPNALRMSTKDDIRWGGIRVLWQLFKVSAPLGIVMGLVSLNTNIPRYQIEASLNTSALGIYSALAYITVAISLIINATGQAVSPRLARYFAEGNKEGFFKILYKMLSIGIFLGMVGIIGASILGRLVLNLMYGAAYSEYAPLLVTIMVAAGFGYLASFLGYTMTAARKFKEQVPLFLICTAITYMLSYIFVPRYGLSGAALATLISNVVQLGGGAFITYHAILSRNSSPKEHDVHQ
ncbi:lipopolysaccharide biosynthesis protein [Deinococcus sonorensis]|uniref:Oligosaccharide flippase family protein n=2 Tax=Deinococcus sonorensis TaxID=309891 RepID=A0AAU7UCI4_9DEIO